MSPTDEGFLDLVGVSKEALNAARISCNSAGPRTRIVIEKVRDLLNTRDEVATACAIHVLDMVLDQ